MADHPHPPQDRCFVGVDVSKAALDAFADPPGEHRSFPNTPDGHAALAAWLAPLRPALVVVEASGAYERAAAAALADAGLAAAVVNPRAVRDFARSSGTLAKTDRVDARVLAAFGRAIGPRPTPPPPVAQARLAELVARRRQVVGMRTMELNRRGRATDRVAARQVDQHLRLLDKQLAELDREIAKLIERDDDWRNRRDLLAGVPGVGATTAAALLAALPELGRLGRRQVAALAGLAPYAADSGTLRGRRAVRGGRAAARAALYMATLTARRCNPAVRAFAERLAGAGKPFKVVITACMRKLLVTLNALLSTGRAWEDQCPQSA